VFLGASRWPPQIVIRYVAMAIIVEPNIAPYYDVTFILGSCVCCHGCGAEPVYESAHRQFTDENYYDQAVAMHLQGWAVVPRTVHAFCPACVVKRGLAPASGAT
jgi:hypothetical protein